MQSASEREAQQHRENGGPNSNTVSVFFLSLFSLKNKQGT